MKKIGVLVKTLTSGGAEKQAILLAKTLSPQYDIHFIIFNGNEYDEELLSWLKEDTSIHLRCLKGSLFFKINMLRKYLKDSGISSLFSYLTGANLYGALATYKLDGIKLYTGIRNSRLPYIKLLIDKLLTKSKSIKAISNSYAAKEYCLSNGFDLKKLIVIPNCFPKISIQRERTTKEKLKIITVARFVPQKDYYTALKVISNITKKNKNILYIIIGYGYQEEKIRGWIKELNLEPFIEIHINPNNIDELLIEADIYFTPSLFEGTSNSIMEAMNASLPIVATNVGDNKQLVKNGVNGYIVKTKAVKEITEKIEEMILNRSLRNSMGIRSNEILRTEYSVHAFKQQYIDLIEKYN